MTNQDVIVGSDGTHRCWWAGEDPLYVAYHDQEWGRRATEDDHLFEMLVLETFQAGLSWITILRKRGNFRTAFAAFGIDAVAGFGPADVERLMTDAGIVRNRRKIEAAIANARAARALPQGFSELVWPFAPPRRPRPDARDDVPASTSESEALARELKRRGFRFVGPTTAYAFMQAVGMVDDHLAGCDVDRR